MALINCSECGNQMSDKAQSCPKCGAPNPNAPMQNLEEYYFNPCAWHNNAPAVSSCVTCGRAMCKTCVDTAPFAINNKPQCNECSLQMLGENISTNKTTKFWSVVKLVFLLLFMSVGLMIYISSPEHIMTAWIIAGIGGLPSALKNFVTRSAEEKWADEIVTRVDPNEGCFQQMFAFFFKVAFAFLLAPVAAIWFTIKNIVAIVKSSRAIKADQADYDTILLRMQEIAHPAEANSPHTGQGSQTANRDYTNASVQPEKPAQQVATSHTSTDAVYTQSAKHSHDTSPAQKSTSSKLNVALIIGIVIGAFALVGLVGGYFIWYAPYAKDRDALRTYVVANNVFLRSSKVAGIEYNKLTKVPYGTRLITYSKDDEWAEVKVDGVEGFVAAPYLLEWDDFMLLDNVWGNADAKECIESSKSRMAVLDYCKRKQLNTGTEGWQLYTLPKDAKCNNFLYPRLDNDHDKFAEFAFVLKNQTAKERLFAIYSFDDDTENPIFLYDEPAPEDGEIKQIKYSGEKYIVKYTGHVTAVTPKTVDDKKNKVEFKATASKVVGIGETFKLYYEVMTDKEEGFCVPQIKDFEILHGPTRGIRSSMSSKNGATSRESSVTYTYVLKAKEEGVFVVPPATITADGEVITSNSVQIKVVSEDLNVQNQISSIASETVSDNEKEISAEEPVYAAAEQAPEFPGGMECLTDFIRKNLKYPPFSRAFGIEGKVVVSFVVEKDGSTTDFTVVRSVDPDLDNEALRVLKSMPEWKPGKQDGVPVRVKFAVPINFRLK